MLSVTIQKNKRTYLAYNAWRKRQFLSNSPKDAPVILYLLPWMLNINHPSVPGFIPELKKAFKIYDIENARDILSRESQFKRIFGMANERYTVRYLPIDAQIQGIYTIGSVATISQTSRSDCDIWVCINRKDFDDLSFQYLNSKLNLIKGWLDEHIKIPVYFFLTDVEDIQQCRFGAIDFESSGSTQKNVLKEEFYRTSLLISGKVPFWWVACDPDTVVDYDASYAENLKSDFGEIGLVDFGNLESVPQSEYYGAALWQLNKSLTHPLKSIIKMLLLKMFLESPGEELLCNKFRKQVLYPPDDAMPPDPSLFTMQTMLEYYSTREKKDHFEFIKKCFYLRFDMKMMSGSQRQKDDMAGRIFKMYRLERDEIFELNVFDQWDIDRQIEFGGLMFEYVTDIYRDIVSIQEGLKGDVTPEDLTIIGRKLSSSMSVKVFKVPILSISAESIKLPDLTFVYREPLWQVYSSTNAASPVIANEDMVLCLAYLVWNGIFDPMQTRMQPNATSVTIQEIINLGKMIGNMFGVYDVAQVHFSKFLMEETIIQMLIVISLGESGTGLEISSLGIIYKNNWEELFVQRFSSLSRMKQFFSHAGKISPRVETRYYIQRNNKYYEKIIERVKNVVEQMILWH